MFSYLKYSLQLEEDVSAEIASLSLKMVLILHYYNEVQHNNNHSIKVSIREFFLGQMYQEILKIVQRIRLMSADNVGHVFLVIEHYITNYFETPQFTELIATIIRDAGIEVPTEEVSNANLAIYQILYLLDNEDSEKVLNEYGFDTELDSEHTRDIKERSYAALVLLKLRSMVVQNEVGFGYDIAQYISDNIESPDENSKVLAQLFHETLITQLSMSANKQLRYVGKMQMVPYDLHTLTAIINELSITDNRRFTIFASHSSEIQTQYSRLGHRHAWGTGGLNKLRKMKYRTSKLNKRRKMTKRRQLIRRKTTKRRTKNIK